jgi:hypothetical protein
MPELYLIGFNLYKLIITQVSNQKPYNFEQYLLGHKPQRKIFRHTLMEGKKLKQN